MTIDVHAELGKGFDNELGLEYIELTPDGGRARLQIKDKLLQPWGIVHGGVYASIAETLAKTELRFEVKAGPTGSLFGSVTPTDIADELWKTAKVRVDRRKIGIDNIKRIGRYEVPIDLFQDVLVEVKMLVVPEGGELPSDDELAAMEAEEIKAAEPEEAAIRSRSSRRSSRAKPRRRIASSSSSAATGRASSANVALRS